MSVLIAVAICLASGVALVVHGLRGRRTDDHPLCRRCGYDLTGSRGGERCPECGADLSRRRAVRVGHRTRRRRPLAAGLAALFVALTTAGVDGYLRVRHVDPTPYKPVWWLRHDLDAAAPGVRDEALAELTARPLSGRLSPSQVAAVADRASAGQLAVPWDPAWGTFVETAHATGRLDRPRWATYARQAISFCLAQPNCQTFAFERRTQVRRDLPSRGESFGIHALAVDTAPLMNASFRVEYSVSDATVDERHIGPPLWTAGMFVTSGPVVSQVCPSSDLLTAEQSERLAAGHHSLRATAHVTVYELRLESGAGSVTYYQSPAASDPIVRFELPLTGSIATGHRRELPPAARR